MSYILIFWLASTYGPSATTAEFADRHSCENALRLVQQARKPGIVVGVCAPKRAASTVAEVQK